MENTKKSRKKSRLLQESIHAAAVTSAGIIISDTNWMQLYQGLESIFGGLTQAAMSLGNPLFGLTTRAFSVVSNNQVILGAALMACLIYKKDITGYLGERGKTAYNKLKSMIPQQNDITSFISGVFGAESVQKELSNAAQKLSEDDKKSWEGLARMVEESMTTSSEAALPRLVTQNNIDVRGSNAGGPAPPS